MTAIALARGRAVAEGVDLRLVTAPPQVLPILAVTGLGTAVRVCGRLQDALPADSKPAREGWRLASVVHPRQVRGSGGNGRRTT